LQNFTEFKIPAQSRHSAGAEGTSGALIKSTRSRVLTRHTMDRSPDLKQTAIRETNFMFWLSIDFRYRVRMAPPRIGWRGRPARERGL